MRKCVPTFQLSYDPVVSCDSLLFPLPCPDPFCNTIWLLVWQALSAAAFRRAHASLWRSNPRVREVSFLDGGLRAARTQSPPATDSKITTDLVGKALDCYRAGAVRKTVRQSRLSFVLSIPHMYTQTGLVGLQSHAVTMFSHSIWHTHQKDFAREACPGRQVGLALSLSLSLSFSLSLSPFSILSIHRPLFLFLLLSSLSSFFCCSLCFMVYVI